MIAANPSFLAAEPLEEIDIPMVQPLDAAATNAASTNAATAHANAVAPAVIQQMMEMFRISLQEQAALQQNALAHAIRAIQPTAAAVHRPALPHAPQLPEDEKKRRAAATVLSVIQLQSLVDLFNCAFSSVLHTMDDQQQSDAFSMLLRNEGFTTIWSSTPRLPTLAATVAAIRARATGDTPYEAISSFLQFVTLRRGGESVLETISNVNRHHDLLIDGLRPDKVSPADFADGESLMREVQRR